MAALTAQPQTGRVGGRLWLVVIPFVLLYAAEGAIPILSVIPPVASHDFSVFLGSDAGQAFMSGNWVWFAVIVALFVFNTALGIDHAVSIVIVASFFIVSVCIAFLQGRGAGLVCDEDQAALTAL